MTAKKQSRSLRSRQIGLGLLILAGSFLLLSQLRPRTQVPRVPYSLFIKQVEDGQVEKVLIGESEIRYQLKGEKEEPDRVLATTPIFDMELPKRLEDKGVEFFAPPPPKNGWLTTLLYWVVPPLIMIVGFRYFLNPGGSRGMFSLSKNKAKIYVEGKSNKITFFDVAGVEEAKIELQEIVEILKNPDRFNKIGARIPKGILLVGPPGTGKTLLAKAVAGEAGVAFLSLSASEFMEFLVGTGAARVRDLFTQAKKNAPCIIFIDELDAIGKSRSDRGSSGSHEEQKLTLNQLLTEMDGFNAGEATVVVLAATNRPETLDPALLRPGRFDRQVLVDRPDVSGRLQILKIYGAKVQLGDDINLQEIATQTPGFVGADLANLVNEAALLAARDRRETVAQKDFKEAIERVIAGLEKKSRVLNVKEKKVVAYHEVGHALVGALMPGGGKVSKISIVPRGVGALGYTLKMPTEDRFLLDEVELREQIATLLGGRAAEKIIFGRVTNGAADDLQRATSLAEKMVTTYGMSQVLGPLAYNQAQSHSFLGDSTASLRRLTSEKTAEAIDNEVQALVKEGRDRALAILQHNRELLEAIAQQLLTTETLEGDELQQLLERVQPVESKSSERSPIAP